MNMEIVLILILLGSGLVGWYRVMSLESELEYLNGQLRRYLNEWSNRCILEQNKRCDAELERDVLKAKIIKLECTAKRQGVNDEHN